MLEVLTEKADDERRNIDDPAVAPIICRKLEEVRIDSFAPPSFYKSVLPLDVRERDQRSGNGERYGSAPPSGT